MSKLKTESIHDPDGNEVITKDILLYSGGKLSTADGREIVSVDGKLVPKTPEQPGTPIDITVIK